MKVYISADMEGVTGVVSDAQLHPEGFDWRAACKLFTAEVVAVVEALREQGVTDILVSDSHGTGQNLLLDRMPSGVRLVRSWPRRLGMMEGIDTSFDGVVLLGYHTAAHNPRGVRAHTMSSATLFEVSINGQTVGEAEPSAWIAGHFGVPVWLITGDDALAEELSDRMPCEFVATKSSISYHCANSLAPVDALEALRRGVAAAVARRGDLRPQKLSGPVTLELTFQAHRPTELLGYLSCVEQVDAHKVRFVGADILEVSAFLMFALHYSPELRP